MVLPVGGYAPLPDSARQALRCLSSVPVPLLSPRLVVRTMLGPDRAMQPGVCSPVPSHPLHVRRTMGVFSPEAVKASIATIVQLLKMLLRLVPMLTPATIGPDAPQLPPGKMPSEAGYAQSVTGP